IVLGARTRAVPVLATGGLVLGRGLSGFGSGAAVGGAAPARTGHVRRLEQQGCGRQAGRLFIVFGLLAAVVLFGTVLGAGAIAPAGVFGRLVLLHGLALGQVDVHGDAGAGGTGGRFRDRKSVVNGKRQVLKGRILRFSISNNI